MNIFKSVVRHITLSLAAIALPVAALDVGDTLTPLYIDAEPMIFDYKPADESQLILIYPLEISSRHIGKFNRRAVEAGFCPKAIVDMKNRAWYIPLPIAKSEMARRMKSRPNPDCNATIDYHGVANKHWGLEKGPTTIVADDKGKIVFFHYGLLDEEQQNLVIGLLGK